MLLLSHISGHIIHLFPTFSLSSLIIFLLIILWPYNYFSSNIFPTFIFLSPTTLYLNLTILLSLHLAFILTLLLPILFTINIFFSLFHSIHISPHKKVNTLSLSLSLSLSLGKILMLCCTSNLGWWIFFVELYFGLIHLVLF